jgi:hypothetical protein
MKQRRGRLTIVVVMIWMVALGVSIAIAPTPSEATSETQAVGWMVYTPNHPNGCSPLPFDCYVIWVFPDD